MRVLRAAPTTIFDSKTGALALGSFAGPLPAVDLAASAWARAVRRKKWFFVAVSSNRHWISCAVVDTGYAATAFVYVFDRIAGRMVADETMLAPPFAVFVADDAHASGSLARFRARRATLDLERRGDVCELRVRGKALELDVAFEENSAPTAVSAVADFGYGRVSATEKRALARAHGELRLAGTRFALEDARAGYDYTHGLLPRRTRWNWAFGMGTTKSGELVAFNLVEGFVGEAECAVFADGAVHPLPEPRFFFDADHLERPWRLAGKGIDLTFEVAAVHEQKTNLGLVRSRFVQPVGTYRGTLAFGGRVIEVDGLPGVVEDQDVVW